jgi:transcription elongation factor GreA
MRGPHTRLHGRIPQAGPCSTFRRVVNYRHLLFSELAIQDTRGRKDMNGKIPITIVGAEKLRAELQELKSVQRPATVNAISEARSHGDLAENAEYHAAKERQRLVEARISLLQKRVSDISLMNLDKLPRDKVGFGSTVHLKDANGHTITYSLVMPEDADVDLGLISTASPIGRALLSKEEGDEVTVTTPNGSKRFEVVKLQTIHEDSSKSEG